MLPVIHCCFLPIWGVISFAASSNTALPVYTTRVISTRASPLTTPPTGDLSAESFEKIVIPVVGNGGTLSSERYGPTELTNFKSQFIFIGAPDEHVQVVFQKFKLHLLEPVGSNTSETRYA